MLAEASDDDGVVGPWEGDVGSGSPSLKILSFDAMEEEGTLSLSSLSLFSLFSSLFSLSLSSLLSLSLLSPSFSYSCCVQASLLLKGLNHPATIPWILRSIAAPSKLTT